MLRLECCVDGCVLRSKSLLGNAPAGWIPSRYGAQHCAVSWERWEIAGVEEEGKQVCGNQGINCNVCVCDHTLPASGKTQWVL